MTGTVFISFSAGINPNTVQQLISVMFQQIGEGFDHLYLMFSTGGGEVAAGMTLYNTMRAMPAKITIHNVGNVDSMGNAVFLAGQERFTCKHSTFMFHGIGREISGWHDEKPLKESLASIMADQKRMGAIIAENTSLPLEQVNELFSTAQTKDADYAVKFGFAHEIRDVVIPHGSPVIPLVFS